MDIIVTRLNRGQPNERILESNPTSQNSKTTGQIDQLKEFAKTETSPRSFGVCLNFIDLIDFVYKCPDDLVINEIVPEIESDLVYLFRSDGTEYELGTLLSQFEEIRITPASYGMVVLIGEYKL